MKKIFILLFCCVSLCLPGRTAFSQSSDWLWAKSAGGSDADAGLAIAVDASGNTYQAGQFASYLITFDTTSLINAGVYDAFLVKYDPEGNILWARGAGGNDYDCILSVIADASGNSYVTGDFYSSFITFGTTTLTNTGGSDVFVAKYDADGNVLWAKDGGSAGPEYARGIALDASGNVYQTGYFTNYPITFDSITLNRLGFFLVKYDSNGNVLWARDAGGSAMGYAESVAVDASGNSYVTGEFWGDTLIFGSFTLINTAHDFYDIFLVKYDIYGNVVWAKSAGGHSYDYSESVAVDASGNSYIGGPFHSSSITFDSIILMNPDSAVTTGLYLAKYDPNGNALWAKNGMGTFSDEANSVAVDRWGNIYQGGYFWSDSLTFGSVTIKNTIMGYSDIYVVKYDGSGNALWGISAGGTGNDGEYSMTVDAPGNIYVTGSFSSPIMHFGSIPLINTDWWDIFIAKFGSGNVGINEQGDLSGISVFPNPASDQINIILPQRSDMEIINIQGQILKTIQNADVKTTLNIKSLTSGIYIIKAKTNHGVVTEKFSKL